MYQIEDFKSVHIEQVLVRNTPVYLAGDIHDNYATFENNLEKLDLRNCIIIFVGDMDFKDAESAFNRFQLLDKELAKRNITSFVIRGNHDNPVLWDKNSQDYIELWREFKSFTPIGPHTELNINGNIGAVVSGAVSLNRSLLEEGKNYWKEGDFPEAPYDMENFGENRTHVDFIIGHSGPIYDTFLKEAGGEYEKYSHFFKEDKELQDDLKREQDYFKQILRRFRPRRWYCGHYHVSKSVKYVWDNWTDDGVINLRTVGKQEIIRIA
jgi:hypothetical protein